MVLLVAEGCNSLEPVSKATVMRNQDASENRKIGSVYALTHQRSCSTTEPNDFAAVALRWSATR